MIVFVGILCETKGVLLVRPLTLSLMELREFNIQLTVVGAWEFEWDSLATCLGKPLRPHPMSLKIMLNLLIDVKSRGASTLATQYSQLHSFCPTASKTIDARRHRRKPVFRASPFRLPRYGSWWGGERIYFDAIIVPRVLQLKRIWQVRWLLRRSKCYWTGSCC